MLNSFFRPFQLPISSSQSNVFSQHGNSLNLMEDMPNTPTREQREFNFNPNNNNNNNNNNTPSTTTTTATTTATNSPTSETNDTSTSGTSSLSISPSSAATTSSPMSVPPPSPASSTTASATLTTAEGFRLYISHVILPWFTTRFTLTIISLILLTLNIVVVYFSAFSFYLTHFVTPDDPQHPESTYNCGTFTLSSFLVFLFFRALCHIVLLLIKIKYPLLWMNQFSQLDLQQRGFLVIQYLLHFLSFTFLILAYIYLLGQSHQCPALGLEIVSTLVAYDTFNIVLLPLIMISICLFAYRFKELRIFFPYIPLTAELFQKHITGLSERKIAALPSSKYHAHHHYNHHSHRNEKEEINEDEQRCAVCLVDLIEGDLIRELYCHHIFHLSCIDRWLITRRTCPLCVTCVDEKPKKNKKKKNRRNTTNNTTANTNRRRFSSATQFNLSRLREWSVNHLSRTRPLTDNRTEISGHRISETQSDQQPQEDELNAIEVV